MCECAWKGGVFGVHGRAAWKGCGAVKCANRHKPVRRLRRTCPTGDGDVPLKTAMPRKLPWNRKRSLFKNHIKCSLRTSTKGRLFRTFNSYSLNFKRGLCNRRTDYRPYRAPCPGDEQFLWFLKNCLLRYQLILCFFELCLVRSIIANLCPIVIHVNALDFNMCRSAEVSFDAQCIFWTIYKFACRLCLPPLLMWHNLHLLFSSSFNLRKCMIMYLPV